MTGASISEAAELVRKGGLIVYPTDTVYGLGCNPFDAKAVARLFEAKGRSTRPVPVLCDSLASALDIASMNETALSLARTFWPGALTIVVTARRKLPFLVDQGSGEVGVRVPALKACTELIRLCGGFLTGTSANISGRPSCRTAAEAAGALGDKVDLILDGGRLRGTESTVVRVRGGSVEVLRRGSVDVLVQLHSSP
jgi:L-threonylcarbamoyladenylate synthase